MKVLNLLFQSSTILGLKPKPISWRCVKFPVNLSINRNRGTVWHFRYQVGRLQHVLVLEDPLFTEKRVLAFEDSLFTEKRVLAFEDSLFTEKHVLVLKDPLFTEKRVLAFEDPLLIIKHACIENLKFIKKTCSRI